jgi:copper chaperone
MAISEYRVTGMTCGHCETSVREEVRAVASVEQVDVSAATGKLVVTSTAPIDDAAVIAAVDEAGYSAVRVA